MFRKIVYTRRVTREDAGLETVLREGFNDTAAHRAVTHNHHRIYGRLHSSTSFVC